MHSRDERDRDRQLMPEGTHILQRQPVGPERVCPSDEVLKQWRIERKNKMEEAPRTGNVHWGHSNPALEVVAAQYHRQKWTTVFPRKATISSATWMATCFTSPWFPCRHFLDLGHVCLWPKPCSLTTEPRILMMISIATIQPSAHVAHHHLL